MIIIAVTLEETSSLLLRERDLSVSKKRYRMLHWMEITRRNLF